MKADLLLLRCLLVGTEVAVKGCLLGDRVVQRIPLVHRVRDLALDTFLGPEEPFDYQPVTVRT